jgi:hypothetical protein
MIYTGKSQRPKFENQQDALSERVEKLKSCAYCIFMSGHTTPVRFCSFHSNFVAATSGCESWTARPEINEIFEDSKFRNLQNQKKQKG